MGQSLPASVDGEQDGGSEARRAERLTLLLRAAKLICPAGEQLCILRDVSASGIKLRLFAPLPPSESFELELGCGASFPIEPVWEEDSHAGFRFAEGEIDLEPLLNENGPFPKRSIRLRASLPIEITAGGITRDAELCDISLEGARFDSEWRYAMAEQLRIAVPGFPELTGRVRWRYGHGHGVVLARRFALDELARLLAAPQAVPASRFGAAY
ncbi:MAG: PilZ domain-containing protein [Novosphingobium sp.]